MSDTKLKQELIDFSQANPVNRQKFKAFLAAWNALWDFLLERVEEAKELLRGCGDAAMRPKLWEEYVQKHTADFDSRLYPVKDTSLFLVPWVPEYWVPPYAIFRLQYYAPEGAVLRDGDQLTSPVEVRRLADLLPVVCPRPVVCLIPGDAQVAAFLRIENNRQEEIDRVATGMRGTCERDKKARRVMILNAESLKLLRRALGLTQKEAGRAVGVEPESWNRWERGKSFPRHREILERLEELADVAARGRWKPKAVVAERKKAQAERKGLSDTRGDSANEGSGRLIE
ncbi:MAG: helix-turn-helix transcriptional regulator [Planctomycetota bacterium]